MEEKRDNNRKMMNLKTVVRKVPVSGGYAIMEFLSLDLSMGGIFISTENLSLFELGEEIEILVDTGKKKFYEGKARVVRSARFFEENDTQLDSGFGLMFLNPDKSFREELSEKLQKRT